ncbi:MAG: hypothetical protein QF586_01190 [Arenicellales bacterium]|nr:hypothetical protein [Acidiferrobacteraceae bacterium]MDP6122268.1 hypothetical protein [Arenicellales bacterium]MDP6288817.1 hypothetical protein [Arenicellales bacterium]MDP6434784.1 hypothetical protein [Arenicellales bacterium]MDP6671508.1 hypothetical protein [Arenicellales bacterium]
MLDFLYLNGWGAFVMVLLMAVPFAVVFTYVIHKKTVVDQGPAATLPDKISQIEIGWIALVLVVFVGVNLYSISYMPTARTANALASGQDIQQVDLTARSWSYEISNRTVKAGTPVRFSGKSADTMHGFAIYHPDGDVLFTMMLMPGLEGSTSIIHTFDEPGIYTIRCLEYCGLAHHAMRDQLTVVQNDG